MNLKRILLPLIPLLFSCLSLILVSIFLFQTPAKGDRYTLQLDFTNADFSELYRIEPSRDVSKNETTIENFYKIGLWGFKSGDTVNDMNGKTNTIKNFRFGLDYILATSYTFDNRQDGEYLIIGNNITSTVKAPQRDYNRSWNGMYGGFIMSVIQLFFLLITIFLQFFSGGSIALGFISATLGLTIGQFILLLIGAVYTKRTTDDLYDKFKTRQAILGIVPKKGSLSPAWAAMVFSLLAVIGLVVWFVCYLVESRKRTRELSQEDFDKSYS